jgi:hypothetical protein
LAAVDEVRLPGVKVAKAVATVRGYRWMKTPCGRVVAGTDVREQDVYNIFLRQISVGILDCDWLPSSRRVYVFHCGVCMSIPYSQDVREGR